LKDTFPEITITLADGRVIRSVDYGRSEENWDDFEAVDKDTGILYTFPNFRMTSWESTYKGSGIKTEKLSFVGKIVH